MIKKNVVRIIRNNNSKDVIIDTCSDMAANLSSVWEVTQNVWAFVRDFSAEQRLQRNVTNIIRTKS